MIPLKDDQPTHSFPFVTIGLIILNIAVFFYQVSLGPATDAFVMTYGAIPFNLMNTIESRVSVPNVAMSVVTSMFLHGGIFHLGGNMLYLWIFGNNIEDVMGGKRFIIFYLVCGVIAVYSHAWFQTQSQIPMIGASGAVSGVLGAYLLLFPNARVLTLIPLGIIMPIVHVPAVVVLGVWFAVQIFSSLSVSLAAPLGAGGVAWFAHVGGFVAGMSLIFFFKNRRRVYRR